MTEYSPKDKDVFNCEKDIEITGLLDGDTCNLNSECLS